jgi:hypothetical protein
MPRAHKKGECHTRFTTRMDALTNANQMTNLVRMAFIPVGSGDDVRKVINTGPLDWTLDNAYVLDTTQSNQLLEVQNLQSIFIDNPGTGQLVISVSVTQFTLRIAPGSQAFVSLFCTDRPVITFSNSSGNGKSQCWLVNAKPDGTVYKIT